MTQPQTDFFVFVVLMSFFIGAVRLVLWIIKKIDRFFQQFL